LVANVRKQVPRIIFGVTGGQTEEHEEELHDRYSSPNTTEVITWAGGEERMGGKEMYTGLSGEICKEKDYFERDRRKWTNIKMNFTDTAREDV
jgi:hypothetical protein